MAFRESVEKLRVQLHPASVVNPAAAIERELDAKLLQYDEKIGGVILAYDRIVVEEPLGRVRIFTDSPFLNLHISAKLTLFCPQPGAKLVGEANYLTESSVGLLVHGIFNAAIADTNIPEEWEFEEDEDDTTYWLNTVTKVRIDIGTFVAFEVLEVSHTNDIISIRGCMLDEDKCGVQGKAEVPIGEKRNSFTKVNSMTPTLQPRNTIKATVDTTPEAALGADVRKGKRSAKEGGNSSKNGADGKEENLDGANAASPVKKKAKIKDKVIEKKQNKLHEMPQVEEHGQEKPDAPTKEKKASTKKEKKEKKNKKKKKKEKPD